MLSKWLEADPGNYRARSLRARIMHQAGRSDAAEAEFRGGAADVEAAAVHLTGPPRCRYGDDRLRASAQGRRHLQVQTGQQRRDAVVDRAPVGDDETGEPELLP